MAATRLIPLHANKGRTVAQSLSDRTDYAKNLPIIAMTANAYADDVQKSLDAGMNAHIAKPIDVSIVEKTILEFHKRNTTKEDTNDRN